YKRKRKSKKNKDSWSLFLDTLTEIGCQYEFGEDDNEVFFYYEDKHYSHENKMFIAQYDRDDEDKDYDYVWIRCLHDIYVNTNDEKEFSQLKSAINLANPFCNVCTYYNLNKTTGEASVFSKTIIYFISHIPYLELFLKVTLSDFFVAQYIVADEMEIFWKENDYK
ncbi:MAG: hypothetical protein K2J86_07820, partial [Prevotella sp.]|nr:hypothetical protein [Prevotella sp.]